jgi:hypothetical protein
MNKIQPLGCFVRNSKTFRCAVKQNPNTGNSGLWMIIGEGASDKESTHSTLNLRAEMGLVRGGAIF